MCFFAAPVTIDRMIRTKLFFAVLWISLLLSMPFLLPLLVLSLPGLRRAKERYVHAVSSTWARFVLFLGGVKVEVRGMERLPEAQNLCIVANHQSYFDIPLIMASIPRLVGFIAKKELRYVPFISSWMRAMGCLFIDRKSARQALAVIEEGAREIEAGKAKLVFPEGTRSRSSAMGPIRAGALKLAFRSNSYVVPVTIDGSYRLLEEHETLVPGRVTLTIHEPISTAGLDRNGQQEATRTIAATLASALPDYSGRDSKNSQRS